MTGSWEVPQPHAVFEVRASDCATVFVRRHGNPAGPRMILSHGNGLCMDAYYPFWSHFTDRFDVFVHDIRNHGWNPASDLRVHNVPTFVDDGALIVREIDRRFGEKPRIGVFHSLSGIVALHQAMRGGSGFSALVLFDPPICAPGGFPQDMEGVCSRLSVSTAKRRDRFENPEAFAERLSRNPAFNRMAPGVIDLFARTTLRRAVDGGGYELACPRDYEAQGFGFLFIWSMTVDWDSVDCPMKFIGGDPTVPHTYMPSMDLRELVFVDYDFIPEATHFLQFEEPERCAAMTLEFLEGRGVI